MKKIISLALTLILVLTAVSSALVFPASAAVTTNEELNTAANWYDADIPGSGTTGSTTTTGISVTNNAWGTETAVAATETPGGKNVPSIKFFGNGQIVFGTLLTLEANKNYKISFEYYGEGTGTNLNTTSVFYNIGIVPNVTGTTPWNTVLNNSQWTFCSSKENKLVNQVAASTSASYTVGTDITVPDAAANTWGTFSATFNSGTATSALLYFNNAVLTSTYLANITLTDLTPVPDEVFPATGWYDVEVQGKKADLQTQTIKYTDYASANSENVQPEATPGNKNVVSVKFTGSVNSAFGKIIELEKNKNYTLSFDYYATNVTTVGAVSNTPFYALGLVQNVTKEDLWSKVYPNGQVWTDNAGTDALEKRLFSITGNNANIKGTVSNIVFGTGTWNTFTAEFNSGDVTSAILVLHIPSGFYMANLNVEPLAEPDADQAGFVAVNNYGGGAEVSTAFAATNANATLVNDYNKKQSEESESSLKYFCTYSGAIAKQFNLTPHTSYTYSYWTYSDDAPTNDYYIDSNRMFQSDGYAQWASPDTVCYTTSTLYGWGSGWLNKSGMTDKNGTKYDFATGNAVASGKWNKVSMSFTTGQDGNVTLFIFINANTTIYLDNFKMEKTGSVLADGNTLDITDKVGVSIKPGSRCGIRFKNNIKDTVLDANALDGYTVVEYGYVVAKGTPTNFTIGATGVLDGVAYNAGVDGKVNSETTFERYEGVSRDFTAVLYNIADNRQAFSVRVYAKLQKAGETSTITIYDNDTQTANVFDVCYEILTADDNQTDQDNVNAFLQQNNLQTEYETYANGKAQQ